MTDSAAVLRFSLLFILIHLATAKPVRRLLGRSTEALALPLTMLIWAYFYWIVGLATTLPRPWGISLLCLIASVVFIRISARWAPLEEKEVISDFAGPILMLVTFALAIGIRSYMPDLAGTEKLADMAQFSALTTTLQFPPHDVWMSGVAMNYYYFGYLLFTPITILSGLSLEWAFSLCVCAVSALAAGGAYALSVRLSGKRGVGAISAMALVVLSNWEWMIQAASGKWGKTFSWWESSRAIPNTITEFPFFSFLLGDFHAHFISLPWLSLAPVVVLALRTHLRAGTWGRVILIGFFAALAVGVHYPLNPWEIPFIAVLTALLLGRFVGATVVLGIASLILFLPFWLQYVRPISYIGWVPDSQRSSIGRFLLHWAPFFLGLALFLFRKWKEIPFRTWMVIGLMAAAGSIFLGPAMGVMVFLLGALLSTESLSELSPEVSLATLALFAIAACEVISLDNLYGGDLIRMNTVFKFYMVAWWGLAISVPVLLSRLSWDQHRRVWAAASVVVLAFCLIYPLQAVPVRRDRLATYPTLDALAYWDRTRPGEREAVNWIRTHAEPGDVLFEAGNPAYSQRASFSALTGRPSVLGWSNHEWIWRKNGRELSQEREKAIADLAATPTALLLETFCRRFHVRWIVVGSEERKVFSSELISLIGQSPTAFSNASVSIFQVR